jgi:hypothetical protein
VFVPDEPQMALTFEALSEAELRTL